MTGEFSDKVKRTLAKRAGEKCSICQKTTSKANESDISSFINLGEAAHIKVNKDGKHLRHEAKNQQAGDISNAIWLCQPCHKEIDSDSVTYSVEKLLEIKKIHENKIAIGGYDVVWQEQVLIKERIRDLEKAISEKEKVEDLTTVVHKFELNELRILLEKTKKEKLDYEASVKRLEETLAHFNLNDPSPNIKSLIQSYKNGDIKQVKNGLNEEILLLEEHEIARKRLLKANIFEIEKDFENAELNYEHAYEISKSFDFLKYYVDFLQRIGKNNRAVEKCKLALADTEEDKDSFLLNALIADLYVCDNKNAVSLPYFFTAKEIMNRIILSDPIYPKLESAKILMAIGNAEMNIGHFDSALLSLQDSLNVFWKITVEKGVTHLRELGHLYSSIGLLYHQNNSDDEAYIYLTKAQAFFSDDAVKDDLSFALATLNLVNVYMNHRGQKFDLIEAEKQIIKAKTIIELHFKRQPLIILKYYIQSLSISAGISLLKSDFNAAEKEYRLAMSIMEEFYNDHGIPVGFELALLYSNNAVYYKTVGNLSNALKYNDKGIEILLKMNDLEHARNLNLAISFVFKFELKYDINEKKECLEKAKFYIDLCSDKTLAKMWQTRISENLKRINLIRGLK